MIRLAVFSMTIFVATSGGCRKAAGTYYPLTEGRTWTYQFSTDLGSGKLTVTNLARRDLSGKAVTPQKWEYSHGTAFFRFLAEDHKGLYELATQSMNDVQPQFHGVPDYWFQYPLKTGTTWKTALTREIPAGPKVSFELPVVIEDTDEVITVPAGTFKGCLRVNQTGIHEHKTRWSTITVTVQQVCWFGPDMGLLRLISHESGLKSENFSLQLESTQR